MDDETRSRPGARFFFADRKRLGFSLIFVAIFWRSLTVTLRHRVCSIAVRARGGRAARREERRRPSFGRLGGASMTDQNYLTIGELARRVGVTVRMMDSFLFVLPTMTRS